MIRRNWTREELIIAFNLYCKLPFGKLHKFNHDIINLAKLIDRTPSAVALKLVNFASLDPELKKRGIKGMSSHSKLDKKIFNEFHNNWTELLLESELLLEYYNEKETPQNNTFNRERKIFGKERIIKVKQRVNQHLFRTMVLSNYSENCAICDLNNSKLLVASHIIPWSKNEKERLNPHNGMCLCSIHDKAFDVGLISIDKNLRLLLSKEIKKLNKNSFNNFFVNYTKKDLNFPKKFYPYPEFLEYHNDTIFLGA